jgi:hypothetical protein
MAFEFLPRRSTWSEAAGRFGHTVKGARIWLAVSCSPHPQPHFIRGPCGRQPLTFEFLPRWSKFYGDRQGRLWRKLSMAQQYSMTRNGIHSALCFARSIHIPKIRAKVSMSQKMPSKASSWRDLGFVVGDVSEKLPHGFIFPRGREIDGLSAPGLRRVSR